MDDFETRFGGIQRLFASDGLERLRRAHVCVIGIGGVGSWAVEALARSSIGELTLIDLDDVCVSNVNRQLHALDGEFGKPKIEVMAQRVRGINPGAVVHPVHAFFTESNAEQVLQTRFDYVLDAIDAVSKKCLLIALCKNRSIPIVTVGGSGGRRDPTQVRVADLALTTHDPLLADVRKTLRSEHGFPREGKRFAVDCVYSPEPVIYPGTHGDVCAQHEPGTALRLDCNSGYGTATFVTGTFGFVAAAQVVSNLATARRRGDDSTE